MSRGDSAGTTVDEWLKGEDGEAADYEEWSEEKEQEMLMLEEKLRKAQMGWSDEQEEILGPVSWPGFYLLIYGLCAPIPSPVSLWLLGLLFNPIFNIKYEFFRYLCHATPLSMFHFSRNISDLLFAVGKAPRGETSSGKGKKARAPDVDKIRSHCVSSPLLDVVY